MSFLLTRITGKLLKIPTADGMQFRDRGVAIPGRAHALVGGRTPSWEDGRPRGRTDALVRH